MNRTKIEWVKNPDGSQGYTWNPITGCLNHTKGLCNGGGFPCYAYKLANTRLEKRYCANRNVADVFTLAEGLMDRKYNDPFYPHFWESKLDEVWELGRGKHLKARGIFVCDMSDLFGNGVRVKIKESWATKKVIKTND